MQQSSSPCQYLTTAEVAQIVRKSVQTLERHRRENGGLPYVRFKGAVLYRRADVERYLAEATIHPIGT